MAGALALIKTAGVLVVDKPRGPTSHDVVARVRRALGTRQVGHAGTLDPMATGVLVVAVGEATKLTPYLTATDKAYEAVIRLGVGTDTLDADGSEVSRVPLSPALHDAIAAVAGGARGDALPEILAAAVIRERERSQQVPPVFSAIKIAGQRSHALARRGEAPDLAPRPVTVKTLNVTHGHVQGADAELVVTLEVSKGYFVRALARDLATSLGTTGHLTALRRTKAGVFNLDGAATLDDAETLPERLAGALVPLERAAALALPVTRLTAAGVRDAGHGKLVPVAELDATHAEPSLWVDETGRLVAIGEIVADGTAGRVLRGFNAA